MLRASAAEIKRSKASSDVRLKLESSLAFLARRFLVCGVCDTTKPELEEASLREESVMVLSLLDSSELDSVS